MTAKELMELRNSDEAPFEHSEYTIWLHNKILDKVLYELWDFRERKAVEIKSSYAACNSIMNLPSLRRVTK